MLIPGTSKQHEEHLAVATAETMKTHHWSMAREAALKPVLGSSGA